MSHVDEGLIHAWLDGAFAPDDPEHARIEAHLGECEACRRAVEVERRIRERASDVLGAAAPDAVRVEPFERILEVRRERTGSGSGAGSGSKGGVRIPMALAATLVLAIGATFFARQMMRDTVSAPSVEMVEGEMMDAAGEQDAGASNAVPRSASPASPGSAEREQSDPAFAERRVAAPPPARDEVASADIVPPSVTTRAQVGTTAVGRAAEAQAVPPPVANEQPVRSQEETRRLAGAMLDSLMRNFPDSAIQLEAVVVTGVASARPMQVADADAAVAVDRLGDAAGTVGWTLADPDTVAARLGMRPLGLAGLEADSVQLGLVGGATVARTVYTVEGQPVELLQWVTGSLNAEAELLRQSRERQAAAGAGVRAAEAEVAAKAVAPVAPAAFRFEGIDFLLRGGLSADALAALAARVSRIE